MKKKTSFATECSPTYIDALIPDQLQCQFTKIKAHFKKYNETSAGREATVVIRSNTVCHV